MRTFIVQKKFFYLDMKKFVKNASYIQVAHFSLHIIIRTYTYVCDHLQSETRICHTVIYILFLWEPIGYANDALWTET